MKTSLIACVAGVNNSGERERGQHAHAPRVPEIPLPSFPPILRPTTQAIALRALKFQFSLITSINSYLPPFPCGSLFS